MQEGLAIAGWIWVKFGKRRETIVTFIEGLT